MKSQVNQKEFLALCNGLKLFTRDYSSITKQDLIDADFVRSSYQTKETVVLAEKLFFISPKEIFPNKDSNKDIRHLRLLKLRNNKVYIRKMRKELLMPYVHKGFAPFYKDGTPNEYINHILISPSSEYTEWLIRLAGTDPSFDESKKDALHVARIVDQNINKVTTKVIRKWNLPMRYYGAIIKLILFNNIEPARNHIVFRHRYKKSNDGRYSLAIEFDADTTKEDLIRYINKYPSDLFNRHKKMLSGSSIRKARKKPETTSLLKEYNKMEKDGKKKKEIYRNLSQMKQFKHLSVDAIKQRIIRYKG